MRINRSLAALGVAVISAVGLVACSSSGPVESSSTPTAAAKTASPSATPTGAAPEAGTRAAPYEYGKAVKYDDASSWTFTWQSTKADGWPDIQAAQSYNTAPAAGENYVLGAVTYGLDAGTDAADGASPTASWGVYYVGNDGNSYQSIGECGTLPDADLLAAQPMYPGASQTGNVCSKVPSAAVSGGTWVIRAFTGQDSSVYFKGAQ